MPALGTMHAATRAQLNAELERRAWSRAEVYALLDHKASLKSNTDPRPGYLTHAESLGYTRGARDAMVEVLSWLTGREPDEILVSLHDAVTTGIVLSNPVPDLMERKPYLFEPPGKPTPWPIASAEAMQAAIDEAEDDRFRRLQRHDYGGES